MMKTLYDISWQVDEPTYRANPSYSQSTIGKFDREGFDGLGTLRDHIETPALRVGSAIDDLLTGSEEEYNREFFVSPLSNEVIDIVTNLYIKYKKDYDTFELIPPEVLRPEILNTAYYTYYKPDTRIRKFLENNPGEYYNNFEELKGKTRLFPREKETVTRCVEAVRNHPEISRLFAPVSPFEQNISKEFQLKFKDTYRGVDYKGMLDLVITDHANKVVTPYDLKSSGKPSTEFPKSFLEYGYSHQARLYWRLLRNKMDEDPLFREYELRNFHFIVVSKTADPSPLLWEYTDTQKFGTLTYGVNNRFIIEDPYVLGERLHYYEHIYPELLPGVTSEGVNDICKWLKDY